MVYHVQFPGLGLEFTLNRVAFSLFGMPIYWYGIIIAAGMMLALVFAFHYARSFGVDADRMVDVILFSTVISIIGGRVFYVAMAPFEYTGFLQMIDIRQGGMAIYGCVIGAFLGGVISCRWRRVAMLPMFDLTAIGFLLGQGVGRWGNFVNQEAFGTNTALPWGMYSDGTHAYLSRVESELAEQGILVDPSLPVHPTFLYESIWCLLGFFVLWALIRYRRFHGELFLLYIVWYGMERCVVEGLRTDSLMIGQFRASQLIAGISVVAGLAVWLVLRRRFKDKPLVMTLNTFPRIGGKTIPCTVTWQQGTTAPTDREIVETAEKLLAKAADKGDGPTALFFAWPPAPEPEPADSEADRDADALVKSVEALCEAPEAAEAAEAAEASEAAEIPDSAAKQEDGNGTDH